jgi:DtxR family Mn-dependent transcriptional regulator
VVLTDGTVTDMLRKLQSTGLLEYTPYYGATLTPRGRAIAVKILRRHRLIELFLHRVMGYGWEQVHDEAERLEHAVSDFFVERIDALMNYPSKDPHGEVIPDARGFRESEDYISLAEAEQGRFTIRKVINASPELLTYLHSLGLPLDAKNSMDETPLDLADKQERYRLAIQVQNADGEVEKIKKIVRKTAGTDCLKKLAAR